MTRTYLAGLAAAGALALSFLISVATTAQDGGYQQGTHYDLLSPPVRTRSKDKIEVVELFWYGCGHCFKFEPLVNQWKAKQGEDVKFLQSPAMWNKPMETHARAFFTAKALGVLPAVHQPLFNALNLERKKLQSAEELAELFAAHGVEKDKFMKAFNSFGVTSQVKQADARARGYKITGTPEIVVDGVYRVSTRTAGGQVEMLQVVDYLINKLRAERA